VRACDLAAIARLNDVLGESEHPDRGFAGRRRRSFVVALNCSEPDGLCFCASMGTGPHVGRGYDLALTELIDTGGPQVARSAGPAFPLTAFSDHVIETQVRRSTALHATLDGTRYLTGPLARY
jgi:hypothetical protein